MAAKNLLSVVFVLLVLICMSSCDETTESTGPIWQIAETGKGGRAIWGTSENDIWVVGINSPMYRWDGDSWTAFDVPAEAAGNRLYAVWGSSPDDYWAGGDIEGGLLHWDGSQWSFVATPNLFPSTDYKKFAVLDIWGASADDVWAVGEFAKVLHWDGTAWTGFNLGHLGESIYSKSFFGAAGSASDDVWIAGTNTTILHWNGTSWSRVESNVSSLHTLKDVWVYNRNSVWIVGDSGLTLYWDGMWWQPVDFASGNLETVWGAPNPYSQDVWLTGSGTDMKLFHWKAGSPFPPENNPISPHAIHSLWGTSPDNVWGVGDDSIIRYHYWQP